MHTCRRRSAILRTRNTLPTTTLTIKLGRAATATTYTPTCSRRVVCTPRTIPPRTTISRRGCLLQLFLPTTLSNSRPFLGLGTMVSAAPSYPLAPTDAHPLCSFPHEGRECQYMYYVHVYINLYVYQYVFFVRWMRTCCDSRALY